MIIHVSLKFQGNMIISLCSDKNSLILAIFQNLTLTRTRSDGTLTGWLLQIITIYVKYVMTI